MGLRARLTAAWAALRGRPVMYRMRVRADHMVEPMGPGAYIGYCDFDRHGVSFPVSYDREGGS